MSASSIEQYQDAPTDVLRQRLEHEARQQPGKWAQRRLRGGTIVSVMVARKRPGEWRLAIARDLAPSTLVEKTKWEEEIRRVQVAIGAVGWTRGEDVFNAEGSIAAVFAITRAVGGGAV